MRPAIVSGIVTGDAPVSYWLDYEQSLFFLGPSRKTPETHKWPRAWLKSRDGRGFFLLGLPPSFLASRGFAAQRWRARALPFLNLKKKRDCSQSSYWLFFSLSLVTVPEVLANFYLFQFPFFSFLTWQIPSAENSFNNTSITPVNTWLKVHPCLLSD